MPSVPGADYHRYLDGGKAENCSRMLAEILNGRNV